MVNFNGSFLENNTQFLDQDNRGLRYGDSLFESIRVVHDKIYFWEDHYLRLMASMRILRMEIPMNFTMEYLEAQILETIAANNLQNNPVRIRLTVFRNSGGLYLPATNDISFIIETKVLEAPFYTHADTAYEVELFKDHYVNEGMLSTLKSNNKVIHVLGSIYASENGYQNCLLLNNSKQVIEALNGNLFLVKGTVIKTPHLKNGCLNGIIRKKLIAILEKLENYTLEIGPISPFELQKADELFITNAITGIQSISKYRKKEFSNEVAKDLLGKLNAAARLS
ncbi:aminotransferase class IV [Cellulophaga sp. F20128]|uniref:aminotransferase class IV n=1 Tax=Cellulophaga sp. F20128 TaxID=2926413 RepID=UPI001FF23B85|nr:aminotransferase class IV [Cellulophaga sp. F20128]MCK0157104.1 aminotransferase class IV [Cellulophaga sp. F20128]